MLFSFALAVKAAQESPSILAEKSSNSVYVNMLVDMFIRLVTIIVDTMTSVKSSQT